MVTRIVIGGVTYSVNDDGPECWAVLDPEPQEGSSFVGIETFRPNRFDPGLACDQCEQVFLTRDWAFHFDDEVICSHCLEESGELVYLDDD